MATCKGAICLDPVQIRNRQRIVKEELQKLKEEQYIEDGTYDDVLKAYNQYYTELDHKKMLGSADAEKMESKQTVEHTQMENSADRGTEQARNTDEGTRTKDPLTEQVVTKNPAAVKVKKSLSPQEVRERNITWSLILGVVLLLIGGVVLATSTWDTLGDLGKTGLIGLVAVLFFGLAYFTRHILKIEKTAFAFHVLGSLFLPIVILSAGYFELLGSYFSFSGEGRFLYGAAGGLLLLPVYLFLAVRLNSRLFVWFSYITFTVFAGFLIAPLYLPVDGFYLGIMAFNALLIVGYHYLGKKQRFQLFMNEFTLYIQVNLILSTLLMLVFYDNELIYSFNLILTAVIYFAMIFVTNHKEYHIVFSAMLVYGAYQLIESSVLHETGFIVYALLGFVFLALPQVMKDDGSLNNAFRYTSAIVSALAFLFISLKGIVLNSNEPSFVLLIAYSIVSLNFLYLSNQIKRSLFTYLSPVFLMVALYEAVLLGQDLIGYDQLGLPIFITGLLLYIVIGCLARFQFLQILKSSSRDVGGIVMLLCILLNYGFVSWWKVGIMFLMLAIAALFMQQFEKRSLSTVSSWIHALSLGFAVITLLAEGTMNELHYYGSPMKAGNIVLAGVIVFSISIVWRQFKRKALYNSSFFVAQGFYYVGMLMTISLGFDDNVRALIVLGGIGMSYVLYKKTGWTAISYVMSGVSLLFYFTVLVAIYTGLNIDSDLYQSLQFVTGAVLLLGTGAFIRRQSSQLAQGYLWMGHIYLPFSLMISLLFNGDMAIWAFIVATAIYGLSVVKAKSGWMLYVFLHAAFTSAWFVVLLAMYLLDINQYAYYSFFIISVVLFVAWYTINRVWGRMIAFYMAPFSVLGIISFILASPFSLALLAVTILYMTMLLFVMHKEKWDIFNAIPLLMVYVKLTIFGITRFDWEYAVQAMVVVSVIILLLVGRLVYSSNYRESKDTRAMPAIDWYTIVGFIAICTLYPLATDALWTKVLPGLLVSGTLILQRRRIPTAVPKWVVFVACSFLLQPYYTFITNTQVPELLEREMVVFPWVALIIYLKKVTGKSNRIPVNNIQWVVLVIVSLLLVQDGMASSTIYDALIIGILSLTSILGGMIFQLKSFFMVGAGVLLLNVFLQSRPFWGDLPWWMYLLVTGSILIAAASYNEWHKQKTASGKETLISRFNKEVVQKIKTWE